MSVQSPVPADDPLMVAWTAYKATEEYANTKKWATSPQDTDGSLWAAFVEGYRARERAFPAQFRAEAK
jgi:hypothetical protein